MNDDVTRQPAYAEEGSHRQAISGVPPRQPPPLPPGPLIGRERDLAYLHAQLGKREVRIVSILGPGGVGKTRLALTMAHHLSSCYEHGVLFLRMDQVGADGLWDAIGRHLSLTPPDGATWHEVISRTLRWQHMLLVLDNCESMPAVMDNLPQFLDACPTIDVLVTSRETFHIAGEREYWLKPLEVPESGTLGSSGTSGDQADSPAVRLFTMRANEVDPTFTITRENRKIIEQIVRRLDGLPLALELAAAYLRHLSPQDLLAMLEEAMPVLGGGQRGLPPRQQSLRQMVRWSLDLLPPAIRRDTLRIGTFPGVFTPETVATVLDTPSVQQAWNLLLTLADKSLISRAPHEEGEDTAFSMLMTVRSVVREELEESPGLRDETLLRRARALAALAREADEHFHGPEGIRWLRRMRQHAADARMIVDESVRLPELRDLTIGICGDLFWFWFSQGHYHWALPRIESLLELSDGAAPPVVRARAHVTAGWMAHRLGQVDRAELHFTQARTLLDGVADRGSLLADVGYAYALSFDRKNTSRSIQLLEGVIDRAPGVENAWHEHAAAYFGIGLICFFNGELRRARDHFLQTIHLGRAHSDAQSIGMSLIYLAHIDRAEGASVEAYWKLREALPLLMELGDIATTALLLEIVAPTLDDLGEHQLGRETWVVGEHLRELMGIPRSPLEQPEANATRSRFTSRQGTSGVEDRPAIDLGQTLDRLLRFQPETPAAMATATTTTAERVATPNTRDEAAGAGPHTLLTLRELEVLQLVARGMTAPEIASALFLSPHTVKRHMANIREKLGVRSQAAAVAALREATG